MFQPIDGGSTQRIEFGDEFIEVHLPPIGYVVDRMPDPKTGKPSEKLIKSEILFDDLPLVDKKWQRTTLPKNWNKWLEEEALNKQLNPNYSHAEADYFRAQEWRRRINGVWIAIGNKEKKPVEYIYLTGTAYLYFNWWETDFIPRFRHVYLKVFYALSYVEENPFLYGLALSTLRRFGKTAMLFCWLYDFPSRNKNAYGGFQAKKFNDAKVKFKINVVDPWRRLPEFFRPEVDTAGTQVGSIDFRRSAGKGKKATENFGEDTSLHSAIDYRDSSESAYDQSKLHRYGMEEPGKWEESDVYATLQKIQPALKNGSKIIGKCFAPTTVEELEKGGDSFIEMFEDSLPSLMKKFDGRTKSGLISLFIPAYEGYVFDEFGRSVINDPDPKVIVLDEDGHRIEFGAKTQLLRDRKVVENDLQALTSLMRKFPWSWEEAKSVSNEFCHFNHMVLSKRLQELRGAEPKYILGNLEWDKKDGTVEFFRDDHKGKFKFAWLPDEEGTGGDITKKFKIVNNVGEDWDNENGKKLFYPKNDHLFTIGCDPIRNVKTDDPTASKAAAYVFRKYDESIEHGRPKEQWRTHKFIVEYLVRPDDSEVFHEDMIKLCRYFGCSILAEDNVSLLRQYFDMRGYGAFIMYRRDFSDDTLVGVKKEGNYGDKAVGSDDTVINNYVNKLHMYYNRYIHLVVFEKLIEQSLKFRIAKHFMKDAVVGAGFTLIASERITMAPSEVTGRPIELELFPVYDQSGTQSVEVDISELMF
jgi:hypothetical protein